MVSSSEAVVLAVPQDVQVSLRNCPLKIPTRVVKIPTGSVKILMCFCENSNAFGENPGMFVIYLPQDRWLCLWELCLGCLVCWEGPGITMSVEHSGNCVQIQLQPRTGHTHGDPGEGPGRLVQLNCCHLNKHQPQRQ